MTDLFAPHPADNLLPYDGNVNDLGVVIDNGKALYDQLLTTLPWQSDKVTLFGKTHITKRLIVSMGDSHAETGKPLAYAYSGNVRQMLAWDDTVLKLKQLIEQQLSTIDVNVSFNTALLNYYPTGMEGMGYHADDEPELGSQPIIASLSLGATRKFVLKHKKTQDKVELYLESGQLIVMHGNTQHYWKHTVTKTKAVNAGRISLTFRRMHSRF